MTTIHPEGSIQDHRMLLEDPAQFYGKQGNWLTRFIGAILRFIS